MESFEYCSLLWVVGFFFCHNQLFFNENFRSLFLEVEDFFLADSFDICLYVDVLIILVFSLIQSLIEFVQL